MSYSEDELKKYFRFWELNKRPIIDLSENESEEIDDLAASRYISIYIEDEEGNCEELLNKEDYDSYNEKEIVYKVNSEKMDASWDKV